MSLCYVESLSQFQLKFFELRLFKKIGRFLKKSLYYSPRFFHKIGHKFLLHFLIHIDVLKLCSKFELIPTSIFQVTAILRKHQNFEKNHCTIAHGFFQNMAPKSRKIFITFSYTY